MSKLDNPIQLYKLLPKSNCRQCGLATCLAFAADVIKGQKRLNQCPHLEKNTLEELDGKIIRQATQEDQLKQALEPLKKEILKVDFAESANRLGAKFSGEKLTLKCLGKNFTVDQTGTVISDCHVNVWVTFPLLSYIINSAGKDPSGQWVPFRELSSETVWNSFFEQRVEKPLKKLIDTYPDFIEDLISTFSGKPVETSFSSDISLVLHPLPKVPVLICYKKPVEDIESKLNVFFDATAEDNLKIDSIYRLCAGLSVMFEKITARHT